LTVTSAPAATSACTCTAAKGIAATGYSRGWLEIDTPVRPNPSVGISGLVKE
jgi:hypothetical protein